MRKWSNLGDLEMVDGGLLEEREPARCGEWEGGEAVDLQVYFCILVILMCNYDLCHLTDQFNRTSVAQTFAMHLRCEMTRSIFFVTFCFESHHLDSINSMWKIEIRACYLWSLLFDFSAFHHPPRQPFLHSIASTFSSRASSAARDAAPSEARRRGTTRAACPATASILKQYF